MRAGGSEVRISAAAPRGLLYGVGAFLDALQDGPLRLPEGESRVVPYATYRASRVGSVYEPELELGRAHFASRFRALARLRFNTVAITAEGFGEAIRYRYVPGLDARQLCQDQCMSWTAFNSNKGLYSHDPAVTPMDQKLALPYALQLAADVEERMGNVPASVFGYD